ncbi:hypothetical protein WJU70_003516 [Enterobacter cloacae]
MEIKKERFDIPLTTIVLGLLFCAVYLFKIGESVFYDYPSYYIYLSLSDVINVALKAVLLYMILWAIYIAFMSWEIAGISFLIGACCSVILKLYAMWRLYKNGEDSLLVYINKGMVPLLFSLLGYFLSKSFVKRSAGVIFIPIFGVFAFIVFLAFNFFIGLNYHSFVPNSTWQTEDHKVLVGTYKDSLLFRACVNGKSYFFLEESKDQKLEMFDIDTSGVLTLRCMPKNK